MILIVLLLSVLGVLNVGLGVAHLINPVHTNRTLEVALSALVILLGAANIYLAVYIAYTL